jgi:hypothetical protein
MIKTKFSQTLPASPPLRPAVYSRIQGNEGERQLTSRWVHMKISEDFKDECS